MRVTADTNIYVSAFQFAGKPLELLDLARSGKIQLSVSEPILEEVKGVLKHKFGRADPDLDEIEGLIRSIATLVTPTKTLDVIKQDPPDNQSWSAPTQGGRYTSSAATMTFCTLDNVANARIMRVADFLKIAERGWVR